MKNLILCNDNILIRVDTSPVKRIVEATDHKGKTIKETKWDDIVKSIIIQDVSNVILKNPDYKDIEVGSYIIMEGNPLTKKMAYNEQIDTPTEKDEKKEKILYYFIKPFDILSIINK